jgi:uncharacterized damage-inducible protein DinB
MEPTDRTDPPPAADEATMLRAFLDYHRETLRWKTGGLSQEQLAQTHPPSTMTLGGLLKHLALVENWWFEVVLLGHPDLPPFDGIDFDADPDWEWRTGAEEPPEEVRDLYERAVAGADAAITEALARPTGLETLSHKRSRHTDEAFTLRWILLHMIEEYARHNGHADLLREAVDGETGE